MLNRVFWISAHNLRPVCSLSEESNRAEVQRGEDDAQ